MAYNTRMAQPLELIDIQKFQAALAEYESSARIDPVSESRLRRLNILSITARHPGRDPHGEEFVVNLISPQAAEQIEVNNIVGLTGTFTDLSNSAQQLINALNFDRPLNELNNFHRSLLTLPSNLLKAVLIIEFHYHETDYSPRGSAVTKLRDTVIQCLYRLDVLDSLDEKNSIKFDHTIIVRYLGMFSDEIEEKQEKARKAREKATKEKNKHIHPIGQALSRFLTALCVHTLEQVDSVAQQMHEEYEMTGILEEYGTPYQNIRFRIYTELFRFLTNSPINENILNELSTVPGVPDDIMHYISQFISHDIIDTLISRLGILLSIGEVFVYANHQTAVSVLI